MKKSKSAPNLLKLDFAQDLEDKRKIVPSYYDDDDDACINNLAEACGSLDLRLSYNGVQVTTSSNKLSDDYWLELAKYFEISTHKPADQDCECFSCLVRWLRTKTRVPLPWLKYMPRS